MAKKKKQAPTDESAQMADSSPENINFEETLADIESIVGQLESGSLGLSESLERYETGIRQLKRCHELLDAAEQRVSILAGFDADGNPIKEKLLEKSSAGSSRKATVKSRSKQQKSTERSDGAISGSEDSQVINESPNSAEGEQLF